MKRFETACSYNGLFGLIGSDDTQGYKGYRSGRAPRVAHALIPSGDSFGLSTPLRALSAQLHQL